jgi:hypothetical protein
MKSGEEDEPLGPVAALLLQLPLGRRDWRLVGPGPATGQLPARLAQEVTVLAHEQHPLVVHEGEDTDRDPYGQDGIDDLPSVR